MGMARTGKSQIEEVFLDTHVVLWLHDNKLQRLSKQSKEYIDTASLYYSPIVYLELQYLYEIKRSRYTPRAILEALFHDIGLQSSMASFYDIILRAVPIAWTRDVFDRIIVANAQMNNAPLITADTMILKHYKKALI